MNSVVWFMGCTIFVLAIDLSATQYSWKLNYADSVDVYQTVMHHYPFYFTYYNAQSLNMILTLKNIPLNVNFVLSHTPTYLRVKPSELSEFSSREKAFHYQGVLNFARFSIHVELYTKFGMCSRKIITAADNLSFNKENEHKWQRDYSCLSRLHPCIIEVDLNRECEGTPDKTFCYRDSKNLVCALHVDGKKYSLRWFQDYGIQRLAIGYIPPLQASSTKLIMTLEKFDNNTEIYNRITSTTMALITERTKIYLFSNETGEYSNVTTLKYGLKKEVFFNCWNYKNITMYVQLGFINTADKISTFNAKEIKKNFKMADNGTILCCLLYVTDYAGIVERIVVNKKRLIYDGSIDFDPKAVVDALPVFQDKLPYIIIAAVVILIVLCVIIFIKIKCYCKNPAPEEPLYNYTSTNILYADLDLVAGTVQTKKRDEECTYAEIIGVVDRFPCEGK